MKNGRLLRVFDFGARERSIIFLFFYVGWVGGSINGWLLRLGWLDWVLDWIIEWRGKRERGGAEGERERERREEGRASHSRPTDQPTVARSAHPSHFSPYPRPPHQPDLTKPPSTHFCFPFPINCLLLFTYLPYRTLFPC